MCQTAVETVLLGGTLRPLAEIPAPDTDDSSEADPCGRGKGFGCGLDDVAKPHPFDLDLGLTALPSSRKRRSSTPSMDSEGSVTTACFKSEGDRKLLNLFV